MCPRVGIAPLDLCPGPGPSLFDGAAVVSLLAAVVVIGAAGPAVTGAERWCPRAGRDDEEEDEEGGSPALANPRGAAAAVWVRACPLTLPCLVGETDESTKLTARFL